MRYASHETFGTAFAALLSTRAGGAAFEHRYLDPEGIADALLANDVDFGITYAPVVVEGVSAHKVCSIPISTWGLKSFAKADFEELPFAAPGRRLVSTPSGPLGLDAWPDESVARRVRYRVTHTQTALELCRSGLAVAHIADFLVALFDRFTPASSRLVKVPVPKRVSNHKCPVFIMTRSFDSPHSLTVISDTLRDVARPGWTP
jgi:DNA-binding transcriptional LysR family regulator